jgi:Flp pilus assembly protein TadD
LREIWLRTCSKKLLLEITLQKIERSYIKLSLGFLCGCVLLVFSIWGGWHFYQNWQAERLTRRAASYLSGGDFKAAILSARRAVQLHPEKAAAARIVAEATERSGDRTAIDWWRQALELEPNSTDDALAVVRCAIHFGDLTTAEKTLTQFDERGKQTAAYHAAVAQFAQARKKPSEAEEHWAKAVELAPNEKSFQVQLAICRLALPDRSQRERGMSTLETLRHDEKYAAAALRALVLDGVAHNKDAEQLRELAKELQSLPRAPFADRMLYLEILREIRDPEFTSFLTKLEKEAPANASELATLLSWLNKNEMSLLAIDFAKGLPNDVVRQWPLPVVLAESYARISDWVALERLIKDGAWENFDFMRHAYLARAWRGLRKDAAAQSEWNLAAKKASSQSEKLSALIQATAEWKWTAETTDLLWALTKFPDRKIEALRKLYSQYAESSDTQGLYRVLVRLNESDGGDLDVKNNLAQISLLLNAEPDYGRKLAEEVYRQVPANPFYATTYAYSLFARGDIKGALGVMEKLKPEQLQEPAVSAYLGIFLAGGGDAKQAREFLERGEKARLLPEERTLLEQAKRRLQSRSAVVSSRN